MILTEEQEMIRDMVRGFAQSSVADGAEERSRNSTFPKDQLGEMSELGLLGMLVPEEHDGSGSGRRRWRALNHYERPFHPLHDSAFIFRQ